MLTFEPPPLVRPRLRQFALFDTHEAGLAARWLTTEIERCATPAREVSRALWKFDIASHRGQLRLMSLQDAGEAEVLVVVASDVARPEPVFLDWLAELTPWKCNRPERTRLVALLAETNNEPWVPPSLLRAALATFSHRAEVEFIWRPLEVFREDDTLWLKPALTGLL